MYDPRQANNPFYFPELDDPEFWHAVAARSGIPPLQYQNPSREVFYAIPPSVYPDQRIVEGSLVDAPGTSLMRYQPRTISYTPSFERPHRPAPTSRLSLKQIAQWIITLLLIGIVISVVLQSGAKPSSSACTPAISQLCGPPTITAPFIDAVLSSYNSPAAGLGQDLYNLGVKYGVDPVYPLGFFMRESSFGTAGVARFTHSLSNMRCVEQYACFHDPVNGEYALFPDWTSGFEAWYRLITGSVYIGGGLTTLLQITGRYAPYEDHNDPGSYACFVQYAAGTWRAGVVEVNTPSTAYCASH